MSDQHAHAGKVFLAKESPQALVKATDAVISICSALSVWNPVEEVSVVGTLLPHSFHFGRAWLEVAEVLLAQTRLLENLNGVARKRGRRRFVGC